MSFTIVYDPILDAVRADFAGAGGDASDIVFTPTGNISATNVQSAIAELDTEKQAISQKNAANGYAGLDASGLINESQLPAIAVSDFLGNFADTTAALADAGVMASQKGDWFTVDTSGGQTYIVIVNNPSTTAGIKLLKTPTDAVSSIFGRTGAVTSQSGDYTAAQITNTPAGSISATTVQTALNQLDSLKAALASPTFTGSITTPVIVGGTSATSSITYKTTTGVGSTGADHVFVGGNNGATEFMRITNSGFIGFGTASPSGIHDISAVTYNPGTVSISGAAVTGTGTAFTKTFKVGDTITATTSSGSETKAITSITSDTAMVTVAFAGTASGVSYTNSNTGMYFSVMPNGQIRLAGTSAASQSASAADFIYKADTITFNATETYRMFHDRTIVNSIGGAAILNTFTANPQVSATGSGSFNVVRGANLAPFVLGTNTGNIGTLVGANGAPVINSGATGTTTLLAGVIGSATNSSSGNTVTSLVGGQFTTTSASGTVTGSAGIIVGPKATAATNSVLGLFGTTTIPTGTWGIYNSSTADNYLSGSLGIGVVPASGYKVDIFGTDAKLRVRDSGQSNGIEIYQQNSDGGNKVFGVNNNYLALGTNNTERMRILAGGNLIKGHTASISTLVETGLQVHGTGADGYMSVSRWSANAATPGLIFAKSRGASIGTRGVLSADDSLGSIDFTGDDGTSFVSGAQIKAFVDGTPGTSDMPSRMAFYTTPNGSSTLVERMRINRYGLVGIGTTAAAGSFDVSAIAYNVGTVTVSGTTVTGTSTEFTKTFKPGDSITTTTSSGSETKEIQTISSDTAMTTVSAFVGTSTNTTYTSSNTGSQLVVLPSGSIRALGTAGLSANNINDWIYKGDSITITGTQGFGAFRDRTTYNQAVGTTSVINTFAAGPNINATGTGAFTNIRGFNSFPTVLGTNTGNISSISSVLSSPQILVGATGTITNWIGFSFNGTNASTTNTITNMYGAIMTPTQNGGTLTGYAGVAIATKPTAATNSSLVLVGTTTIPSGNYGIYNNTPDSSPSGYISYMNVLGNTQSSAQTMARYDLGTSATANTAILINMPGASSNITGIKIDRSTGGSGLPLYITGGRNDGAYDVVKIDNGTNLNFKIVQNNSQNAAAAWNWQIGGTTGGNYTNNHQAMTVYNGDSSLSSTGTLTAKTLNTFEFVDTRNMANSATITDTFNSFYMKRQNRTSGSAVLNANGSVAKFENFGQQSAGTLNDNVHVLELAQTGSIGGHILFTGNSVPTANPASGILLYLESGALKARSAAGTITTIAAA